MDSMRGILMMLGVVLHAAHLWNPQQTWLIHLDTPNAFSSLIISLVHSFRMPAFFILSGFFCILTLQKYSLSKFIKLRFLRIVIPLVVTACTINLLQTYLASQFFDTVFPWHDFFLDGGWVAHLWFLNNLIIYFIVSTFVWAFLKPLARPVLHILMTIMNWFPIGVWHYILPLVTLAIIASNKLGFPLYYSFGGIIGVDTIVIYSQFFIFGIILRLDTPLMHRFARTSPFTSAFNMSVALYLIYRSNEFGSLSQISEIYGTYLLAWSASNLCFYIFYHFFNTPSKTWRFISDASYTVYLFHQIIVIMFGMVLIYFGISSIAAFPVIVITVTALTLGLHRYIISTNKWLRFAYSGK